MSVKLEDKTVQFLLTHAFVVDDAVNEIADDILNLALAKVPIKEGTLYESGQVESKGTLHYIVSFGDDGSDAENYAGAQEAGTTRGYKINNYTTAGTGAHFLEKAGKKVSPRIMFYLNKAQKRLEQMF